MPTLPNASGMSEMEAVKAIGAPKWTPEPWFWTGEQNARQTGNVSNMCVGAGEANKYGERAKVVIGGCGCCGSPYGAQDPAEHDANARLIISAPRLYDTLTHLIAAARKVSPSDPAAAEIIEMCARAEQEQAKARGETA